MQVLIVGAGMSGLMAARALKAQGISARVIESGRSVGGRMATRRVGEAGLADHGAQFFTVRGETLRQHVDEWLAQDLVTIWGRGWSDGSTKRTIEDGHPRYVARGGMNRLAKRLAEGLDIALNRRVMTLSQTADGWELEDSDGESYAGAGLILTPPMPQTLSLLAGQQCASA